MRLPQFVINAFTVADKRFSGNPAAVVPLDEWLPDTLLQAIAEQNNLAETAFVVVHPDESGARPLRWFTPAKEVRLCGHATLASAAALGSVLKFPGDALAFNTLSGVLTCERHEHGYAMDFPADPLPQASDDLRELAGQVLGKALPADRVREGVDDLFIALEAEREVLKFTADGAAVRAVPKRGVILTAPADPGSDYDVVSRCFYPEFGIDEDPATGSAHTAIGPYWCGRLGAERVVCRQASRRDARLTVRPHGEGRVSLRGRWDLFSVGEIDV